MAWICDKNGNRKCEIKKLSYNGTFMEVSSITVTVESPAPIDFTIGDYIDWDYDGLRYTLDTAAGVEKQARRNTIGNAFVYENLVFLSPLQAANNVDFLDVVIGNTVDFMTNTEFSFYGTAWDYAKRLEANLCRLYGDGSWKVRIWTGDVCYDTAPAVGIDTGAWENKLVDVSKIKCLGGFQQIYDIWGCAYVFSVENGVNYVDFYDDFELYAKTWKQGGVEKIFAYGKGNGLYKIRHTPDADHVLVTRLRAYGSTENLPANYYLNSPDYHVDGNESSELAIANLMLPASEWTKDGVKAPMNAYLERNTDLYGVREASVAWDGSDEELGEIKPSIYGLTIQDLLDIMSQGDVYRPVESKWPDTTQRIDKIITGAAPTDNGAVAEAGYDFSVAEDTGSFVSRELSPSTGYSDIDFNDLVMGSTVRVSHLAEYRVVPTSENVVVASFDVQSIVASTITDVSATITPYINGSQVEDATIPCLVSSEVISREVGGVEYTKRYFIHLIDANSAAVVFSTMRTGTVTFKQNAHITRNGEATKITVLRNEYAVSFKLLRGNKAIDKFFAVTIPQIGFDLSAAMTGNAKLCMRSGYNQPREFPIVPSSVRYDSTTDTWYFRCKRVPDQSTKTYFPNSDAVIATGDEYYISGIAMPVLYVEIAANKLLEAASAWLELHSKPRMLSSVDVDNKIMAQEGIILKEGMSLPLNDDDLNITPETQESRVIDNIRIEEGEASIRTFAITLRDKKERSSLDMAIRGATSNMATNSSVSDAINAAESKDHGALTGRDMPNQHPISAITGLEEALAALTFFEEDGNGNVKLKDEYGGVWTKGFVSARGLSDSEGAAGGNASMSLITGGGRITNGTDTLDVYSMAKVNELLASAGTVQKVAGVSPSDGDIPVASLSYALGLGAAASYGIGSVASGDTGLVTGGSVYSAINSALSSVLKFVGVTTTVITDGSTTNPVIINGSSYTAVTGNVVLYGAKEYLWTGSAWEEMGDEASWALKTVTISAGTGLTGGGNLTANRTISLSPATIASLALADSAYQLPQGGIPKTDLASAVQTSLGNADTIAGYFSGGKLKFANLPDLYIARTKVRSSGANDTLLGITALSNASASDASDKSRIEWDATNQAWHFYGNLYTDGWWSGRGVSPGGGGGGGGIDPAAMWSLLGAPTTEQINATHIAFPVTSVAGRTGAVTAEQIASALGLGSLAYQSSLTTAKISDIGTWISGYNFATQSQLTAKQDVISDLATIRNNANLGATAYNSLGNYVRKSGDSISGVLYPSSNSTINLGTDALKFHYLYVHRILNVQTICNSTAYNTNMLTLPSKTGTIAVTSDIPTNNNQLTNGAGYITGINSSMVTTALGYTPANSASLGNYVPRASYVSNYGVWNDSDYGFSLWTPSSQGAPTSYGTSFNFRDPQTTFYHRLMFSTSNRIFYSRGINTTTMSEPLGLAFLSDLNNYLPLSGGTMSNTNLVTNLNADLLDGYHLTSILHRVTVANNTTNDFNTFENITLTGRGDPTTGASLLHAPWTGAGPAGGYGVLTYLWGYYGTQIAIGYSSNNIYIRYKYYSGGSSVWKDDWAQVALTTSNVASATKLQTARTIWGQSFDGTGNVSGEMTGVSGINFSNTGN